MTNLEEALVSVIVPAYNAEYSIGRCLNSLTKQTIPIEIIVVDDGSTDNTEQICKQYSNEFSNIIYIRKENGGVSSARNLGLSHATGKYIGFVDSDDYVAEKMFEHMSDSLENDDSQVISIVYPEILPNHKRKIVKDRREIIKDIVCSTEVRGYPWNKLFRKDLIDKAHLRFDTTIHVMEDKLFCLQYMDSVTANGGGTELNEKLYYYDEHEQESKKSYGIERHYNLTRYTTGFEACKSILKLGCISNDEELRNIQLAITAKHCVQISRACIREGQDYKQLQEFSKNLKNIVFTSRYLSTKEKIGWVVLQYFPTLLKFV
jgi:glycosyltransferase involved in cell wall biosynthesis